MKALKKGILLIYVLTITACAQNDKIVGVWDVKNEYYQAVYEIVENQGKFYGKVHYYNDGKKEYKGENKKEDYFLTDVKYKDGKYIGGKMYLPDGSFYFVQFTLKDDDTLEALMTVEKEPYRETWTRNTKYN